jgi:TonB family protein
MDSPLSFFRWLAVPAFCVALAHAADNAAPGAGDTVSAPLLNAWVAPVYPPKALAERMPGRIRVRFIVDEQGAVTKARVLESSNEMFDEAAVQAILQWRFAPATEGGKTVAKSMELTVPFDPPDPKARSKADPRTPASWAYTAVPSATTKAAQKTDKSAVYPPALLPLMLRGEVQVSFTVDPEGRIRAPKVLLATHPDFVPPALAAMAEWTFRPAIQGDLPVASPFVSLITFDLDFPPKSDRLAACGVTLAETAESIEGLSRRPEPLAVVEPAYPYELLLAGTTGEAEAEIVISPGGRPTSVVVRKASDPAFGRALAMALQGWFFRPALRDGSGVAVKAVVHYAFAEPAAPVARLVERLKGSDTAASFAADGLDAPLRPVYRTTPVYPAELRSEDTTGQALVEFIIDREGHGRIAHVISASREEFGVSAATAVEQWIFDPPTRGHQPVDVRVRIPINFPRPPKADPSAP